MSEWRAAGCLLTLKHQLDTAYPNRPRGADGFIASSAHHQANPTSDHEPHPDPAGGPDLVFAFDITTAPWSPQLAEDLRLMGVHQDRRLKYLIWDHRIASARDNYAWRPYTGTSPHTDHIHVSTINDPDIYDLTTPWPVLGLIQAHAVVPPTPLEEPDMVIVYATGKPTALLYDGKLKKLDSNAEKDAFTAAGVPVKHLTPEQFTLIQKVAAR